MHSRYPSWAKRSVDIALGSVLALLALPIIVVLSIASLLVFRASPIFVQRRVGRDERPFWFPKIRSLPKSAPRAADKAEIARVETNWFGRFLRDTHLDEFPQLFLVPIGRMSLVGPRPEMPELIERYSAETRLVRALVRPGCTGLWQVSEAAKGQIYEAPQYDEYYSGHLSFALDARILWRTLRVLVVSRDGEVLPPLVGELAPSQRREPGVVVAVAVAPAPSSVSIGGR